jgi:hypothetical protein
MLNNPISRALMAVAVCVTLVSVGNAQDRTRFVLKLDNDLISSFKSYGSLRSAVPAEFKQKISFVELQYADSKDSEPVELDLGIQINGDNANIVLDDDTINRIKGQPVRVAVDPNSDTFSQIVLMYDAPVAAKAPEMNDGGGMVADMYYIKLSNGETMSGSVDGFNQFQISTRFGKVSMPMDQVAGIKFHTDSRDSCVVVLNNGDTVTGVPVIPAVELKTDWGQADIEPKSIEALTTTSTSRFTQDSSDFGVRWKLRTGNSVAPGAPGLSN